MLSYHWGPFGYPSGPLPQTPMTETSLNYDYTSASKVYTSRATSADDNNKTCLICGDRATGLHYGIVSCEGCKGFFKRSVCNKRIYRCVRDRKCMMSRQKRNRCQYCRMLKCLQVGMNRKAIREDGMPGGRNKSIGAVVLTLEEIERIMTGEEYDPKSRISVDPKPVLTNSPTRSDGASDQLSPTSFSSSSNAFSPTVAHSPRFEFPAPPMDTPSSARRSYHGDSGYLEVASTTSKTMSAAPITRTVSTSHIAILPEVEALVNTERAETENNEPVAIAFNLDKNHDAGYPELFELLCKLTDRMLYQQVQWSKHLPFKDQLTVPDLTLLLRNSWVESMLLSTLHSQPTKLFADLAVILTNYIPSEEELRRFGQEGLEIINLATATVSKYHRLRVSFQEFVCLKAINFFNPETEGLADAGTIETLSKRHYYLLYDQVQLNNNEGTDRFRALLLLIPEIRQLARKIKYMSFENAPLLFKAILHACNAKKVV